MHEIQTFYRTPLLEIKFARIVLWQKQNSVYVSADIEEEGIFYPSYLAEIFSSC